ncbi:MAG: hydroxyisourate hydrolase [Actinomycetes bacterium]|jgi:5-hydroxyisourate hydrolase|nr:hydroxyisourate hydrolase [Actinomycetes bacterium]
MSLSTHVLDATTGRPAIGVPVRLERGDGGTLASAATDADGRIRDWGNAGADEPGSYRLIFGTGAYFAVRGIGTFYPEVAVTFAIGDPSEHYHVPLLLSPYAYSTYRGS